MTRMRSHFLEQNLELGTPRKLGYASAMRSPVGLFAIGLWVIEVVAACDSDRVRPPLGPTTGGDGVVIGRSDEDSGTGNDEDAGPGADADVDAGAPASTCQRIPGFRSTTGDTTATSTKEPVDFVVTRQAIRWSSDCANPILTVELSDGACPAGMGHELEISLSINDIEDGQIHVGNNDILPENDTSRITVRYTRPSRLPLPRGTWGTCDSATGTLIFLEAPELTGRADLVAQYQLMLTACDGSGNDPIAVAGTFNLGLRFTLSEICPMRTL
jgi:hypothetical protein